MVALADKRVDKHRVTDRPNNENWDNCKRPQKRLDGGVVVILTPALFHNNGRDCQNETNENREAKANSNPKENNKSNSHWATPKTLSNYKLKKAN